MLTYTVELKPQQEGGYTVTVPVLPGCISEGDTMEEALENIKDAVEGYIKVLTKHSYFPSRAQFPKLPNINFLPLKIISLPSFFCTKNIEAEPYAVLSVTALPARAGLTP